MEPVERAEITEKELTRCPLCAYSLTGLPDRHACPECGFLYDKRMVVEVGSFLSPVSRILFAGMFLGCCVSVCVAYFRGNPESMIPALAGSLGPLLGFAGYVWLRRGNNKIILSEDCIQVIRKGKPSPVYFWDEIESVERSNVDGFAIVYLRDGNTARLFGERFFGSHRRTREFVGRLRRYQDHRCTREERQPSKEPEKDSPRQPDGPDD